MASTTSQAKPYAQRLDHKTPGPRLGRCSPSLEEGASVPVRVLVADDDVLLRAGICSVLRDSGYEVTGRAGNPQDLAALVALDQPDLAVIDIRMPPTHTWEGIEAARTIRATWPDIGILLLSAHVEIETALDLLQGRTGIGYLLKSRVTRVAELTDAVDRIAAGGTVIDPEIVGQLLDHRHHKDPLAVLSEREREVLGLVAEGRSNAGIAHRLWIAEGSVEKHVRSILAKLELSGGEEDHRRVLAVLTFLDNC